MPSEKKFNSYEIARKINKDSGADENITIVFQKKYMGKADPKEYLKFVMSLGACNLKQTMEADFIAGEIGAQDRDAIIRDHLIESLQGQYLAPLNGKKEVEEMRLAVMEVVGELSGFWNVDEDSRDSGPGPRYYCVKEVLKRLGDQPNFDLHDALFELMYLQHQNYLKFFREFLEKVK